MVTPVQSHSTVAPETATLKDGRAIIIRRIDKSDWPELIALHLRLSPHARRMRFFTPKKRLRVDFAQHLADVDFVDRGAFVACFPSEKAIRAVGRYERDTPDSAEIAFVVEDNLQGQGIATHLMRHLEQHARQIGFQRLRALVLRENSDMLELFHHYELPQHEEFHGDTVELLLDLA